MTKVFISLEELEGKSCRWIDARYALDDPNYGKDSYRAKHVKGAVHWDLGRDLSNEAEGDGRHPLPNKSELTHLFERSGLQLDDLIVVYDNGGSPFATRAWWILHYAGFTNAFVLLEGLDAIEEAGFQLTEEEPVIQATKIEPMWQDHLLVTRSDVEEMVDGKRESILIDARANARYRGEVEPLDRVAGHIPTAFNFDWEQVKENGQYAQTSAVKNQLEPLVKQQKEVTVYCGSGVTATPIFALLTHLGYKHIRLYAGSYSDWVAKEDAVVETGERKEKNL